MATHRSVLLDHQSIVDGVSVREKKDLTITINDETGVEEYYFTTTRFIGDKSFTTKQSITGDEEKEESIETEMDDSELENFKNEWEENPTIREVFGPPQNPSSDSYSDDCLQYGVSTYILPWR